MLMFSRSTYVDADGRGMACYSAAAVSQLAPVQICNQDRRDRERRGIWYDADENGRAWKGEAKRKAKMEEERKRHMMPL